jgi:ketosteroid isomerase-like protein
MIPAPAEGVVSKAPLTVSTPSLFVPRLVEHNQVADIRSIHQQGIQFMKRMLAVALLLAASRTAYADCSAADKNTLEVFDKAWSDATAGGDRAFLQNAYADDYAGLGIGGATTKAMTIDNTVKNAERNRARAANTTRIPPDQYVIVCTPNSATITHRNTSVANVNGKEVTSYGRSIHVLEKRAGRWQVVASTGNALNDQAVLIYMESDWNDAAKRNDIAWFERNYADDATDVSSRTGTIHTKAEEIASMKDDKTKLESLDLSDLNVRVDGNVAIVTGINTVKGRDAQGKSFERRSRFTDTFIKRDGRWLVWATQGTVIQ